MTEFLGRNANEIPCGRCCPPAGQRVRVFVTDDHALLTEQCPAEQRDKLSAEDLAANGDRVLRLRTDGRCEFLSHDNTHCLLVDGDVDKRPYNCRDGWPDAACATLGCPKIREA